MERNLFCGNSRVQRKGIYRGDQEKSCGIFTSLGYRPWNFKGCITSFGNSSGEASFCLEFLGVK